MRRRWLAVLALAFVGTAGADVVTWDGDGDGVSWSDPLNWSGDALPGSRDDAVIPGGFDVTHAGGVDVVASLEVEGSLLLSGGELEVIGSFLVDGGSFEWSGGTLDGAPEVRNGTLELGGGSSPIEIRLTGASVLGGAVSTGQTVWVQGGGAAGAEVTVVDGTTVAGVLRMESINSSWTSIVELEGTLLVEASGMLVVNLGTGGARSVTGGDLLLAGGVEVGPGESLIVEDSFTLAGGTIDGDVEFLNTMISITSSPPRLTVLDLGGAGNTLLTDVPANVEVWVHGGLNGTADLSVPQSMQNDGTIRLESTGSSWASILTLASDATLTNGPAGTIRMVAGSGGLREIRGAVETFGLLEVSGGGSANMDGAPASDGGSLQLSGGSIEVDGRLAVLGDLTVTGGSSSGLLAVVNGSIDVGADVAAAFTISAEGTTTLVDNMGPSVEIWVRGGGTGTATLLTSGAMNAGIVRLESINSTWISQIEIDGTFENLGQIDVLPGSGGLRRSLGGTLINAGTITVADGAVLNILDGYTLDGGRIDGDHRLLGAVITQLESPAAPTTLRIVGDDNLLLTDNLPNVELWIEGGADGTADLMVTAGIFNQGAIRLETNGSTFNSRVTVIGDGILTNAPGGLIESRLGTGGARSFRGGLFNEGTVFAETGTSLRFIAAPDADGHTLTQAGGAIDAPGRVEVVDGTLLLTGGSTTGEVAAENSVLEILGTVSEPSQVFAEGQSTLLDNASASTSVFVRGGGDGNGGAVLTAVDAINLGTVRLESVASSWTSRIVVDGTFENGPSGLIEVAPGSGGDRVVTGGSFVNAGSVEVSPGTMLRVEDAYTVAGGRIDGPNRFVNVEISQTIAPAAPNTLDLAGTGNTLLTDNLENVELWVHGGAAAAADLAVVDGTTNHGIIRLESTGSTWSSEVTVLAPANGPSNGTLFIASGGVLEAVQGSGGTRRVHGTVVNGGTLRPGHPDELEITQGFEQESTGTFAVEFAGALDFALLDVADDALLAGAIEVTRTAGFEPAPGEEFTVLTSGLRSGFFDGLVSCDPVTVSYTDTTVRVTFGDVTGVTGDLTGDGMVDGADLGLLLGGWGPCTELCCPGDLNDDAIVDGADLGILLGNWS